MKESLVRNALLVIAASTVLAFIVYGFDVWLFSSNRIIPFDDILFLEAVFSVLAGILLLLGSGGIGRGSERAAMLASTASAIGRDTIGPSEVYRRDAWKPKGYVQAGLVLVGTGIILLLICLA
jgi:hypothetical protein